VIPMSTFIDPRTDPKPHSDAPVASVTDSPDRLAELHQLCREGRLYDVEAWIKAGHPLQLGSEGAYGHRFPIALTIAIEKRRHSLLPLLLCNGYRLDLEPISPLSVALEARRRDLVDRFWAWGADPLRVSADTVFATYNSKEPRRPYREQFAGGAEHRESQGDRNSPCESTSAMNHCRISAFGVRLTYSIFATV
jgi:hypothetical protein